MILPLLEVYNKAAWKQTVCKSDKLSSIDTCIPKPESGLQFGNVNKSVDLTKKLPWNVCIAKPRVHLILITASYPIFRVK